MNLAEYKKMFIDAGIPIINEHELMNQYWPRVEEYAMLILSNPWWLFETPYGNIKIGPRKRVYVLDWSATPLRQILTDLDVTKSETMLHAYTHSELVDAIAILSKKLEFYDQN